MENFIPNLSYYDTTNIINKFLDKLLTKIKNKFNFINLRPPIILKSAPYNLKDVKNRSINFDNISNYEIYEFFLYFDNWIRYNTWYYKIKENDCIFSEFHFIERDTNTSNNEPIDNLIWNFEIYAKEENRNANFLEKHLLFFWKEIVLIAEELELDIANNLIIDLKSFSLKQYVKANFLLKIKEIFNKITLQEKQYILNDVLFYSQRNDNVISRPIECYDQNNTQLIVVLDKNNNSPLTLLETTFRPNLAIYNSQMKNCNKEIFENDFYEMLKNQNNPITINIKINLTKLMYFILNKQFIFEIPFANGDFNLKDIYMFFNKKNK